jgi:hypothetical protein
MATLIRACTESGYRKKNAVIITLSAILSCFALIMTIYNLIKGSYLFAVAWLIATILLSTYVIIRINTVFATYITTDRTNIYMKNWSNDFLPYDYDNKIKILSEFIPAKTKLIEIPLNEISMILIGTKNFIKRNTDPETEFTQNIRTLEKTKDFYRKKTISSMDILYVETYDKECYYMPIVKFTPRDVIKIIQTVQRRNPELIVKVSSKAYRSLRMPPR